MCLVFHSQTETIPVFWRERNVCKDQQTAPDWGRSCSGKGKRSAGSAAGPLRDLLSRFPQGAPCSAASALGRDRATEKEKLNAYEMISQALPTGTIRRPTPSHTPIWLTSPTHAVCPSCTLTCLPPTGLSQFWTKAGQWVRTAPREKEQQGPGILWESGESSRNSSCFQMDLASPLFRAKKPRCAASLLSSLATLN